LDDVISFGDVSLLLISYEVLDNISISATSTQSIIVMVGTHFGKIPLFSVYILGAIYTKGDIDYERKRSYTLKVKATDKGKPPSTATATVSIAVIDLNDNKPTFSSSLITVPEDQATNAAIVKLTGQDADSGVNAQIDFTMETKNTPFAITKDGSISIKSGLDRETIDSYALVVRVTDRGTNPSSLSSTGTVNVKVSDINDNAPVFRANPYDCSIAENSPANAHVCYTQATDRDLGENARVTYSIAGGEDKFSVVSVS